MGFYSKNKICGSFICEYVYTLHAFTGYFISTALQGGRKVILTLNVVELLLPDRLL